MNPSEIYGPEPKTTPCPTCADWRNEAYAWRVLAFLFTGVALCVAFGAFFL